MARAFTLRIIARTRTREIARITMSQYYVQSDTCYFPFPISDSIYHLKHLNSEENIGTELEDSLTFSKKVLRLQELDGLAFSRFIYLICISDKYCKDTIESAKSYLMHSKSDLSNAVKAKVLIRASSNQPLDLLWNRLVSQKLYEFMQLSDVLSLLSTFGGAYSSLGDKYKSFAKTAGMISLKQLRIALRLGNSKTVAQCKVYFCISLVQTHKYKDAKRILLDVYNQAKNEYSEIYDDKLVSMCKGVWSKLKYEWLLYKKKLSLKK